MDAEVNPPAIRIEPPDRIPGVDSSAPSRWRSALAGLLAAGTALAVGELVAAASSRLASPVISVGDRVIDAVPRPVKDFAVQTFGTNDKLALLLGIYSLVALFGLGLGIAASRRFAAGVAGIAAFGAVGVWAAGGAVGAPWWAGAPSVIGAVAGIGALALLLATIDRADRPEPAARLLGAGGDALARRSFLKVTAGVVVVAAGVATTGRWLQRRFSAAASRLAVILPTPSKRLAPPAPGVALDVAGISPYVTPNRDFYRIDTNLTVPQIAAEDWSLRIHGLVDREVRLTYQELLERPMVERRITIACVSNEVGGGLVGNALWLGTPLADLLDEAGIDPSADQVVGRAFDGFTTGFPVADLSDGREALLVVGMNGEPLPLAHGFPARIVVPGLYGYVSATKWVTEIELTTFDAFDQYWVARDWSPKGPIKTMARIDTPKGLDSSLRPGPVAVAGVAWAPTRGISKVEVQVDDGPWEEAELGVEDADTTWRQWLYRWEATPGRHRLVARATDGDGAPQPETRATPFPDGAQGWHDRIVIVPDA